MAHGTLLNVMWQPGWEGSWERMDICICMAKSFHCSPETITTQNKTLKEKKREIRGPVF